MVSKGAFQEMDAISLLKPHTKLALRPVSPDYIAGSIQNAYRTCWYGRPGTTFIDLPADLIQARVPPDFRLPPPELQLVPPPPKPSGDPAAIFKVAQLLKAARAPLVVIGKGSAYAQAELPVRQLIERTGIPFLPTPMAKGVVPDSHPLNASSARSVDRCAVSEPSSLRIDCCADTRPLADSATARNDYSKALAAWEAGTRRFGSEEQ